MKKKPNKTYYPHDPYLGKHKEEGNAMLFQIIVIAICAYIALHVRG